MNAQFQAPRTSAADISIVAVLGLVVVMAVSTLAGPTSSTGKSQATITVTQSTFAHRG